jgi:hypothetical protein
MGLHLLLGYLRTRNRSSGNLKQERIVQTFMALSLSVPQHILGLSLMSRIELWKTFTSL